MIDKIRNLFKYIYGAVLSLVLHIPITIITIINLKLDLVGKLKDSMLLYLVVLSSRFIPVTILTLFLLRFIEIVYFVRSLFDLQSPITHKFILYPLSYCL